MARNCDIAWPAAPNPRCRLVHHTLKARFPDPLFTLRIDPELIAALKIKAIGRFHDLWVFPAILKEFGDMLNSAYVNGKCEVVLHDQRTGRMWVETKIVGVKLPEDERHMVWRDGNVRPEQLVFMIRQRLYHQARRMQRTRQAIVVSDILTRRLNIQ